MCTCTSTCILVSCLSFKETVDLITYMYNESVQNYIRILCCKFMRYKDISISQCKGVFDKSENWGGGVYVTHLVLCRALILSVVTCSLVTYMYFCVLSPAIL